MTIEAVQASVQYVWTVATLGGGTWEQILSTNPRRVAVYFLRSATSTAVVAPAAAPLLTASFTPLSGDVNEAFLKNWASWPVHGPLAALDWWSYGGGGYSVACLEVLQIRDPCETAPQPMQPTVSETQQSTDSLQQLLGLQRDMGPPPIPTDEELP